MNTTTTGRAGLFLSLALDSKEYKRERERESIFLLSCE